MSSSHAESSQQQDAENDVVSVNFFMEQGDRFVAAERFPEAIESYTKAIEFYPSLHQLYSCRSGIYVKSRKYDEALQDANKTIEIHPMWPEGYFRKGSAFFSMGDYVNALIAFSDGLNHDSTNVALLQGIKEVNQLGSSLASTFSKSNKDENLLKNPEQTKKSKRISLATYRKRTLEKQDVSENDTPNFEATQNNPKAVQKKTEVLSPEKRTKETLKNKGMLKAECPEENSESEIPNIQQLLIKMKDSLEAVVTDNFLIREELKELKEKYETIKCELEDVKEDYETMKCELQEVKKENARNVDRIETMKCELQEVKKENIELKDELKNLKDNNKVINNAVILLKEESQMLSDRLDNFVLMQR